MGQFDHLRGQVVMFDGPDWIGKDTQIDLTTQHLRTDGYGVYVDSVHGGGLPIGQVLRSVSLNPELKRSAELDLYLSLAPHEALLPNLQAHRRTGDICLINRSPYSMWAYQVFGDSLDKDLARPLMERDLGKFEPELVIIYRASWQVLEQRAIHSEGAKHDYFERKIKTDSGYFERVITGYADVAESYHLQVIDAEQSIEAVSQSTLQVLQDS